MKNKSFNWSSHIDLLENFPDGKMAWEKQFVSAVLSKVPKEEIKKALEVGCSNGRWLRWFNKEYRCKTFGLDNNPEGFDYKDKSIKFVTGDCRKLPFEDESFDVAFSLGLVEHFSKKDKEIIIKEQARIIKKEGYLICLVPLLSLSLNFFYVKLNYDLKKGFKHFYTSKTEIENYFENSRIKIEYSKVIGNIFESFFNIGKFEFILKNKLLSKIFATEILVIGKKQ